MGSAQAGGSDGGPWLANFGAPVSYSGEASAGPADGQAVVGVTSWGFDAGGPKIQGASWFGQNAEFPAADYGGYGAGNIGALVQHICTHSTVGIAC